MLPIGAHLSSLKQSLLTYAGVSAIVWFCTMDALKEYAQLRAQKLYIFATKYLQSRRDGKQQCWNILVAGNVSLPTNVTSFKT